MHRIGFSLFYLHYLIDLCNDSVCDRLHSLVTGVRRNAGMIKKSYRFHRIIVAEITKLYTREAFCLPASAHLLTTIVVV